MRLIFLGFIEKHKDGNNGDERAWWSTTVKGNAFCIAKFLTPLGRKEAIVKKRAIMTHLMG